MPELPDVEIYRRFCENKILDKKIENIKMQNTRLIKAQKRNLENHLIQKKFNNATRHGKYLFLKTNNRFQLVLHFGMTGNVSYYKNKKPKYSKFIIRFSDNYKFSYNSIRKLGKIYLIKDKEIFIAKKKLGPDAYFIDEKEFNKILDKRRGSIKTTLINQRLISGIGNIYADEILFQSNIHPKRKILRINKNQLSKIYSKMNEIFAVTISKNANPNEFPKKYLIKIRKEGEKCKFCGGKIEKIKLSGRSTYFCNSHQK